MGEDGIKYCSSHCRDEPKEVFICPECGKGHLIPRTAARGKKKGATFYGCTNFPRCKTIINGTPTNEKCKDCGSMMIMDNDGKLSCYKKCNEVKKEVEVKEPIKEDTNVTCPKCGNGHLIKRVASKGKMQGNVFFGCSNFPKCKAIISLEEYNKVLNN
jgi:ssDNA-binding Zn-finger/Zn-ribbon topoisomerase 1